MSVTLSGRSGLTNAYTSVLSATGSFEISGASRCEDMADLSGRGEGPGDSGDARGEVVVVHDDLLLADHDGDLSGVGVADVRDQRLGVPTARDRRSVRAGACPARDRGGDPDGRGARPGRGQEPA